MQCFRFVDCKKVYYRSNYHTYRPFQGVAMQTVHGIVDHRYENVRRIAVVKFRRTNVNNCTGRPVIDLMCPQHRFEHFDFVWCLKHFVDGHRFLNQSPQFQETARRTSGADQQRIGIFTGQPFQMSHF